MNRAQHQLMQVVQKIPAFDGLSLEQAERLIKVCRFKKYEIGDTIYDIGESSDEMMVLIKGTLSVLSASGQTLGEVGAGNSTGEMGVFTGHERSATIVAKDECAGLALTRAQLMELMNSDRDMKSVVLENVVKELSVRLADANQRLDVLSRAQEPVAAPPEPEPVEDSGEPEGATDEVDISDDEMPEAEDTV